MHTNTTSWRLKGLLLMVVGVLTLTIFGVLGSTRVFAASTPVITVSPSSLNPQNPVCQQDADLTYTCVVTLAESATSSGDATWRAGSVLVGVSLNPAKGTLAPGQSTQVTIGELPCQKNTINFSINSGVEKVKLTWDCTTAKLALDKVPSCLNIQPTCSIDVRLRETADSTTEVNWTASSTDGATINPTSGTLLPGGAVKVAITFPCSISGTVTFSVTGGTDSVSASLIC